MTKCTACEKITDKTYISGEDILCNRCYIVKKIITQIIPLVVIAIVAYFVYFNNHN